MSEGDILERLNDRTRTHIRPGETGHDRLARMYNDRSDAAKEIERLREEISDLVFDIQDLQLEERISIERTVDS